MVANQKKANVAKARVMAAKKIQAAFRGAKVRGKMALGAGNRGGMKAMPPHVRQHLLATHCPFDARAKGARQPSQYAVATNVHTSTVSYTLTTDASGNFDVVVLPHPIFTVLGGYSTITGGVVATSLGTGGTTVQAVRGNVSAANLGATYANYRVVAWGVRLKSLQSFTNAAGRVYAANIPTNPQLPLVAGTGGTTATVWAALPVPFDGTGVSNQLLNYPRSVHMNGAELVSEGGIELRPHITGPGYEHFKESSSLEEQGLCAPGAAGAIAFRSSLGYGDVSGGSLIAIRGDGLTASAAVMLVEVIFHLEGSPIISSSAGAIVPAAPVPPPTPNASLHMASAVASLATSPFVTYISDKVRDEAQGAARKYLPGPVAGIAEKMLGIGFKELPGAIEYGASLLPFLL